MLVWMLLCSNLSFTRNAKYGIRTLAFSLFRRDNATIKMKVRVWTVFTEINSMEWPNQWWAYPEPDFLMKKCQFGSGFWGYAAINITGVCYAETLLLEYSL